MNINPISTAFSVAVLLSAILPSAQGAAQAYVNQANPNVGSVYLDQVPPDAKLAPPAKAKPAQRAAAQRAPSTRAAAVAVAGKPHYPDVGSGSLAVVRPGTSDWPTVGSGAVTR
ncbi:hypothetical protein [Agrobacterium tumefaciens]|uniref:hypothetical protein n=1 Tax=Agrobacterium tumefaciens TaxID=358 RepID=UPI00287D4A20|nr:hypothetical protein [Agrobacterium tumefaciens]MDS7594905.1 hypothetical protein [Agrobacterium tumefaciens]